MLLCDGCNRGYHIYCLRPKLKAIPEEDEWYCPDCTPKVRVRSPVKKKSRRVFEENEEEVDESFAEEEEQDECVEEEEEGEEEEGEEAEEAEDEQDDLEEDDNEEGEEEEDEHVRKTEYCMSVCSCYIPILFVVRSVLLQYCYYIPMCQLRIYHSFFSPMKDDDDELADDNSDDDVPLKRAKKSRRAVEPAPKKKPIGGGGRRAQLDDEDDDDVDDAGRKLPSISMLLGKRRCATQANERIARVAKESNSGHSSGNETVQVG